MKDSADQLFQIYDKYKQHKSLVESVAYQQAILEEIRERQRIYGVNINPYEVKPDKDKARRAYNVQSLFQENRVFFDLTDRGQRTLLQEMIMFSGKSNTWHDDLVDAMVYALTEIKKWKYQPQKLQSNRGVPVYGQAC
jgi:predicted phage terminase large subunit-like protein